jgi:hypothetical protein
MHKLTQICESRFLALGCFITLLAGVVFSAFSQSIDHPRHNVLITAIQSDSVLSKDTTVAIKVFAENRGKDVVEAVVTLVDSIAGDTIENWYPLFPPESADSIVLFWNTKGKKTGAHILSGFIVVPAETTAAISRLSRTVTVNR